MPNSSSDQGGQSESSPAVSSAAGRSTQELLAELLDLPADQRSVAVDRLGLSAEQRRELLERLAHASGAGLPSTSPPLVQELHEQLQETSQRLKEPRQIGPYRILECIGSGGFGEVYKAERRAPMRQMVAIKIIKLGFDTREIIARFDSERQALARMDHPNIARVLDAGTTDTGRPYFVMEYVAGKPITDVCDENKLTIKERLLLFTQVCQAINHAHTKALIHRDIKAGNVLAYMHDGKPTVRVIDFGIAKALTGDRLTEQTFNTERGQIIGTYDSMSPEQAEGSPDIDTRTDVYSLGVLLYELLSGVKPFDYATLVKAADHEIKRIIREVEPPRPSTRLSSLGEEATKIAAARRVKLDALASDLKGELEWIPLKAMRKERDRRYASTMQLAEDIQNYLENKPLLAGAESRSYLVRKWIARNKVSLATTVLILALIALGVGAYIHAVREGRRLAQEEQRKTAAALADAEHQARLAKRTVSFLTDLLTQADPRYSRRQLSVQELMGIAAKRLPGSFRDEPDVRASVAYTLAKIYLELGLLGDGLPLAAAASRDRRQEAGLGQLETLEADLLLAIYLLKTGELETAEALVRETTEAFHARVGDDNPDLLNGLNILGAILEEQGRVEEALQVLEESYRRLSSQLGLEHRRVLRIAANIGRCYERLGHLESATHWYRTARDGWSHSLGNDHPDTLTSINNMGYLLQAQGKLAEAEPLYREALEGRRRVLGDDHPDTLILINNMGSLLQAQGKSSEAEPLSREAVARAVASGSLGPAHPDTRQFAANHAKCLDALGRHDEAAAVRQRFGIPDPTTQPSTMPATVSAQTADE